MPLNRLYHFPIRPRLEDSSWYIGKRTFFITINTFQKRQYFVGSQTVASLVLYLKKVSEEKFFDVITYCFMPNHLHLLVQGKHNASNLLQYIKLYKQHTGFRFTKIHKQELWATSFYDHVLREEETVKTVGRYVLLNPVRAGIVADMRSYPFNGSFVYDLEELYNFDPFLDASLLSESGLKT
jgi:putative transposase